MRKINKIVVHCSDSCDSLDIGAKDIDRWHREDNGWSAIGYHYVIRRNGMIEEGRPLANMGAHVKGHNRDSIGICWVGRKTPTMAQTQSLYELIRHMMTRFELSFEDVYGHYEFDSGKTCPNLNMDRIRANLVFPTEPIDFLEEAFRVAKRSED